MAVRPATRRAVSRAAFSLVAVGAVVGVALLIGIAEALEGGWRLLALALLTPVLVVSLLALWRAARLVAGATARREGALADLRARGVVGVLALPARPLPPGEWQARVDRLRLAAGPHLLAADATNVATPAGQRALHALYDLLAESRPLGVTLVLPPRATLALLEADGAARMWDLSSLIGRASDGEELATEELLELEALVQERAASAAFARDAGDDA